MPRPAGWPATARWSNRGRRKPPLSTARPAGKKRAAPKTTPPTTSRRRGRHSGKNRSRPRAGSAAPRGGACRSGWSRQRGCLHPPTTNSRPARPRSAREATARIRPLTCHCRARRQARSSSPRARQRALARRQARACGGTRRERPARTATALQNPTAIERLASSGNFYERQKGALGYGQVAIRGKRTTKGGPWIRARSNPRNALQRSVRGGARRRKKKKNFKFVFEKK